MKFFWSLSMIVAVCACSTKKRGVIIDNDKVIQTPQENPYQTILVGDSATFVASSKQVPTFVYDKIFFDLNKRSRCLDLGEEEKTCLTLYAFEAIKSGNTMIEVQIKNGQETVETYRNPILIAEKDNQPQESVLALSDQLAKHLALLPSSLSMIYLQEQTMQLAKLPDNYQYQFVVDDAGFTMLQSQVGGALNINITPKAVGRSAIIVEVIDNSRARQLVVVINVDVQFKKSYQLPVDSPFLIQTFGNDWRLSYDHGVVGVKSDSNCHRKENCLAKYALTVKGEERYGSLVKFTNEEDNVYQFTVTSE